MTHISSYIGEMVNYEKHGSRSIVRLIKTENKATVDGIVCFWGYKVYFLCMIYCFAISMGLSSWNLRTRKVKPLTRRHWHQEHTHLIPIIIYHVSLKWIMCVCTLVDDDVSSPLEYLSTLNSFLWNLNHWWCAVDRTTFNVMDVYKRSLKSHFAHFMPLLTCKRIPFCLFLSLFLSSFVF